MEQKKKAGIRMMLPNRRLIKYELLNIIGNPFTLFFGVLFPIMMSAIMKNPLLSQVPESQGTMVMTGLFLTMVLIIPMAGVMLGHSANYSQELEKEVPQRMNLFGISNRKIMMAKMISNMIFLVAALIIYIVAENFILELYMPSAVAVIVTLAVLFLVAACLFALVHGLAMIFKKFGPTYAITMFLYFGMMLLCGMMGIQVDQLPKGLKYVANLVPMSYLGRQEYVQYWQGGSYSFAPLIQSILFFIAVSVAVLLIGMRKNKRVVN